MNIVKATVVEFNCYLKCIKRLHDISVCEKNFIQNNTGKKENEANIHC